MDSGSRRPNKLGSTPSEGFWASMSFIGCQKREMGNSMVD